MSMGLKPAFRSMLGAASRWPKPGLDVSAYDAMIKAAFQDVWWNSPKLVQGSLRNFKVTYPEDFGLASAILSARA